ncbi:MAG: hypothetical protein DI538_15835 [Azospira oryzae]|jgi:hypothetical protein|nr:MAG: hypothetical protein DI538_15835 [Azospira oryzae]
MHYYSQPEQSKPIQIPDPPRFNEPPRDDDPPQYEEPPDNDEPQGRNGNDDRPQSNDDFHQLLATLIMIIVFALTTSTLTEFGGGGIPAKDDEKEEEQGASGLTIPTENDLAEIPLDNQPIESDKKKLGPLFLEDSSVLLYYPPAGDQGKQLSCTAFSVAYAMVSYYEKRRAGYSYDTDVGGEPSPTKVFSPAFVYNSLTEGNCREGISFRSAFTFVRDKGVCKWIDCTYDGSTHSCGPRPSSASKQNAKDFLGYRFYQPNGSFEKYMEYLDAAIPLIIGIYTSKTMFKDGKDPSRPSPFFWNPDRRDAQEYHAMLCIGFDKEKDSFILLNSWGRNWGDNGYCYIDKERFMKRVREVYIARLERATPEEPTKGITKQDTAYFAKAVTDVNDPGDLDYSSADAKRSDQIVKKRFLDDYAMLDSLVNRTAKQDSLMRYIEKRYALKK